MANIKTRTTAADITPDIVRSVGKVKEDNNGGYGRKGRKGILVLTAEKQCDEFDPAKVATSLSDFTFDEILGIYKEIARDSKVAPPYRLGAADRIQQLKTCIAMMNPKVSEQVKLARMGHNTAVAAGNQTTATVDPDEGLTPWEMVKRREAEQAGVNNADQEEGQEEKEEG